jgi:hypothetical protein
MKTAVAAPDHDPRPIRMLVLEELLREASTRIMFDSVEKEAYELVDRIEEALDEGRDRR